MLETATRATRILLGERPESVSANVVHAISELTNIVAG